MYHLRSFRLDDELRVLRVGLNPSLPEWHPRLCASKAVILLLVVLDESLSPGDEVDLESVADKPFSKFVGQLEIFCDGRHTSPFSLIVRLCVYVCISVCETLSDSRSLARKSFSKML